MLNQGSTVDVWFGQKAATPRHALILAIVGSNNKWIALLPRSDFAPDALGNAVENLAVRLVRLPHKPSPKCTREMGESIDGSAHVAAYQIIQGSRTPGVLLDPNRMITSYFGTTRHIMAVWFSNAFGCVSSSAFL